MAKYDNYKQKHTPAGPPNTFTAKVTTPNSETPRLIPNAKIWNGVLVRLVAVGKGKKTERAYWSPEGDADVVEEWEYYAYVPAPLYCKAKFISEHEEKEALALHDQCAKKPDWTVCFERYRHALLTMGDNGYGYLVEDNEAANAAAVLANRTATLTEGFRGFRIIERLPAEVWGKLKPYATFYSREQVEDWYEDMDDFHRVDDARHEAGWNYSAEIIDVLGGLNWKMEYQGEAVTSADQITAIDQRLREEAQERDRQYLLRRQQGEALKARFKQLVNWQLMEAADTPPVDALPDKLIIPLLNWDGGNIYGGGYWGKQDADYLYEISNNSMDGDDWSRNNSRSGIIWRTPLTDQLKQLLTDIATFENQK